MLERVCGCFAFDMKHMERLVPNVNIRNSVFKVAVANVYAARCIVFGTDANQPYPNDRLKENCSRYKMVTLRILMR